MERKGAFEWDLFIKFVIAALILFITFVVIKYLWSPGTGAIEYAKNVFGGIFGA